MVLSRAVPVDGNLVSRFKRFALLIVCARRVLLVVSRNLQVTLWSNAQGPF